MERLLCRSGPLLLTRSPAKNDTVTLLGQPSGNRLAKEIPMTLILLMVFEIGIALALGFVVGRIYQIRRYELERGFTLPPAAHIPRP
jgi:hypothetical protein